MNTSGTSGAPTAWVVGTFDTKAPELTYLAGLLRAAGRLAERHGLRVQTHLAENTGEIAATSAAFPDARDYLAVYEDHGLGGPRALFAHCIHLSPYERTLIAISAVGRP